MFGLTAEDDGSRNDPLVGQNMISGSHFRPDIDALRAAPTRIVVAVGEESRDAVTGRAAVALAELLGTAAMTFPGGHAGFLADENSQTGKADEFAANLRRVIAAET
jgi:hypothetical protein